MLHAIPCHIITGFLGTGKTTTILQLLAQKPADERWAVLVNEFGEIGLDGQLIESAATRDESVFIREVPGGCMCCSSKLPMQVAINLLLMKAKPHRLLIEPTGLGHPAEIQRLLRSQAFSSVLSLDSTLTVVNPQHFTSQKHLDNSIFQQQLSVADYLIVNKTDVATPETLEAFKAFSALSTTPYVYTSQGNISLDLLHPQHSNTHSNPQTSLFIKPKRLEVFQEYREQEPLPSCGFLEARRTEGDFTSIGWRIAGDRVFSTEVINTWLLTLPAVRVKAHIRTNEGWQAVNISQDEQGIHAVAEKTLLTSAPVSGESRIEFIFYSESFDNEALHSWTQFLTDNAAPSSTMT